MSQKHPNCGRLQVPQTGALANCSNVMSTMKLASLSVAIVIQSSFTMSHIPVEVCERCSCVDEEASNRPSCSKCWDPQVSQCKCSNLLLILVLTTPASHRGVLDRYLDFPIIFAESPSSFDTFSDHLRTNAIGPIIVAQKLLQTGIPIGSLIFMSSDSGSAGDFRAFEDGYDCIYD